MAEETAVKKERVTIELSEPKEKIFMAAKKIMGFSVANGWPTDGVEKQSKGDDNYPAESKEAAALYYTRKFSKLRSEIASGDEAADEKARVAIRAFGGKSFEKQSVEWLNTLDAIRGSYVTGAKTAKVAPTSKLTFDI